MCRAEDRFFNWHALGVPKNQMQCFLNDGSVEDFITATLDPVPSLTTLRVASKSTRSIQDDNYHYLLCLNGRYTRASCPAYLKPEGFQALKAAKTSNAFKLHTDTILKWTYPGMLTVASLGDCRMKI